MLGRLRMELLPHVGIDGGSRIGRLRRVLRDRSRWPWHAYLALCGRRPGRLSVQIQTTSACNGRCTICPYDGSWHSRNPGRMTDELFERILRELAGRRLEKLCLYLQNEPLLDPSFPARLARACDTLTFGLLELSTNASTLSRPVLESCARVLERVPHEIWVSFHGVDDDSYRRMMGLDFDQTLDNVVSLLKMADRRSLNVTIRSAGLAMPGSEGLSPVSFDAGQMVAFWEQVLRRHGISRRPRLVHMAYHNRAGSLARPATPVRRSLVGFYCRRADEWLHVLYNGDVILCCNDYQRRTVVGNLANQGLDEVLLGQEFLDLRLKVMGLRSSEEGFLCKLCARPGG